ncbi:MAG TPA: ATP-binding cassette domain-containing protein [bacterium]|nr:ATP-binding cassette domain-containing protein [bacterium]
MIEVSGLSKHFPLSREQKKEKGRKALSHKVTAVDNISFQCRPGRIFTLLGPNGAGKTTTLRLIAALLRPDSGSIRVAGYDTQKQAFEVRRRLGFLTGTTRLYERLTPLELVKYYADLYGMEKQRFEKRRDELFDLLDMHEFAGRRIAKLSGGMRQKVSIVRTIIHDPEVMVFDEPTVGLDVLTSQNIITLIRQCREEGKTIIFSTHIMGEVSLLSDDMAVIHEGKLLFNGSFDAFSANMRGKTLEAAFIDLLKEAA